MRVCHLSTVHRGLDVRIFYKECISLASAGYDTHLVIQAESSDVHIASSHGVHLHCLPRHKSRFKRLLISGLFCALYSLRLNSHVYHFHDPELIPLGIILRLLGKKVIYDVHEDLPRDILSKDWIAPSFRRLISVLAEAVEKLASRNFFSVVSATPFIARRFVRKGFRAAVINNYPRLTEFGVDDPSSIKRHEICYVGGISRTRGIQEIVQAMGLVESSVSLNICGHFAETDVEKFCASEPGWKHVNPLGFVDRAGVRDVLARSMAGLVTLHPLPNYIDAQPIKMFEYMSAGLPVIASDFPLWREIIAGNDCGLLVDPLNPAAIAEAIDYLITHPKDAQRMGRNGRRAVENQYNWEHEGQKLLAFYDTILKPAASPSSVPLS
jgi:glycosyltransferase involved in cell wall biosynthesis